MPRGQMRSFISVRRSLPTTATLVVAMMVAACDQDPVGSTASAGPESQIHRMTVKTDTSELGERIRHMSRDLPVVGEEVGGPGIGMAPAAPIRLEQVAEVEAPRVDGVTLQATHVALDRDRAFVAYNLQGSMARGAVDLIDRIDGDNPRLRSTALLQDSEVNAVAVSDGRLVLATAVEEGAWKSTAAIEAARFRGDRNALSGYSDRAAVPSFAATGVAVRGDRVYATSGDEGGGLTVLDLRTLRETSHDAFDDARSVVVDRDRVVVLKGSPAELRIYDADAGRHQQTVALGHELPEGSKSGLDLVNDLAVVALGRAGVALVDLTAGRTITELGLPDVAGVAPEDLVANEVAIHRDLIFVAAGGGGLRVIRASRDLDRMESWEDVELRWAGFVDFGDAISVNFVTRRRDRLFVAGGSGGLRVIAFRD